MSETKSPSDGTAPKSAKAYSCIRCFERKVKCDRESPCSNCVRSNGECIFRVPPAPKRRKKRTQEDILKARLCQYEDILRSKGIDVYKDDIKAEDLPETPQESLVGSASHETNVAAPRSTNMMAGGGMMPQRGFSDPRLIVSQGRTRFIENNLWTSVAEEFRQPSDAMPESSDEDDDADAVVEDGVGYVLGTTPNSTGPRDLHPLPEQVFTLWQIFLDNVNPLSKLVHVPSLQPAIVEASSHLDKLPKNFEALLFAIYSLAVLSLQPQECEGMLGESREVLLSRYRNGTKRALARAKFLGTSDLMVLQAFILHLLCMRDIYDSKTLWTLIGVGNRIAEGMGCHRDGTSLGLGPFETELRRRIWWQLIFLDFRTAELTGSGVNTNIGVWDVRIPTNCNDIDIWPGMKEPPKPHDKATEMIFCLTRYEVGQFWKRKILTKDPASDFDRMWAHFKIHGPVEEKEKGVDELEQTLALKFVQFCDPSVPVEFMAIIVTRAATSMMRLMTHHPRRYAKDEDVPENARIILWTNATKCLEIDNMLHASKHMIHFTWHTDSYFQWHALIYVLGELKKDPLHEQVDRAWQLVNDVFEHHPRFVTDIRKPIHFAVGSLCLKAWKAREDTWSQRSVPMLLQTPDYIVRMHRDREERKHPVAKPKQPNNDYFGSPYSNIGPSGEFSIGSSTAHSRQSYSSPSRPESNHPISPPERQAQQIDFEQQPRRADPPLQQLQFHPQDMQQPQSFWWDYEKDSNMAANTEFNFNMDQLAGEGQDPMDWYQWDFLLKDGRLSE